MTLSHTPFTVQLDTRGNASIVAPRVKLRKERQKMKKSPYATTLGVSTVLLITVLTSLTESHSPGSTRLLSSLLAATASAAPGCRGASDCLMDRPFAPLDPALFVQKLIHTGRPVYPSTPPLVPAQGTPPTEAQALALLQEYLRKQYPTNPPARAAAVALFNNAIARRKIPEPSLRAAFAALKGTLAESSIGFLLHAKTPGGFEKVKSVRFDVTLYFRDFGVARAFIDGNEQQYYLFNRRYIAENPFLFTQVIAHETLHQDILVTGLEEVVAHTLNIMVYLQQLRWYPEMAQSKTELSRRFNTNALALLNTGLMDRLGIFESNTHPPRPVLPGSLEPFTSWWDTVNDGPNLTPAPGNALLGQYLPGCATTQFNVAYLECVEDKNTFTPDHLMAAAHALRVDTGARGVAQALGVFRPRVGRWFVDADQSGATDVAVSYGIRTDIPVPGNYDGSGGLVDFAVFRPSLGRWFVDTNWNGVTDLTVLFGAPGDLPVPGDYNGDGRTDFAVFRPRLGRWLIDTDRNGSTNLAVNYGVGADIPVPADYNGDRITDLAVFRPALGRWFIDTNRNGVTDIVVTYGVSTDIPVPADYNGDGRTDLAVFRRSSGRWFIDTNRNGGTDLNVLYGVSTDIPVPADYNGDLRADLAVFRPKLGRWFIDTNRNGGTDKAVTYGAPGDIPLRANGWILKAKGLLPQ
jgi:hypothetical protein